MFDFPGLTETLVGLMLTVGGIALLTSALIGRWWGGLIPGGLCLLLVFVPGDLGPGNSLTLGAIAFGLTGLAVWLLAESGTDPGTRRLKLAARLISFAVGLTALAAGVALVKTYARP